MSQKQTRSGKFGSSDDAVSTSNSSGHLLSAPALNDNTWVVHVEQIRHILVEKQDRRIKLICWSRMSNETTREENTLSDLELVEVAVTQRILLATIRFRKGVGATLPWATLESASIRSGGSPLSLHGLHFPFDVAVHGLGRPHFRHHSAPRWWRMAKAGNPPAFWGRHCASSEEALRCALGKANDNRTHRSGDENQYQRHTQSSCGPKIESEGRYQVHRSEHLPNWPSDGTCQFLKLGEHIQRLVLSLLGVTSRLPADSLLLFGKLATGSSCTCTKMLVVPSL